MYEEDRTTEWAKSKNGSRTPVLAEWKNGQIARIVVGDRVFVPSPVATANHRAVTLASRIKRAVGELLA